MDKLHIKIPLILIALIQALTLFSCAKSDKEPALTTLPPVVTEGLPEKEKVTSNIKNGGFTVTVYETYAEIVAYEGEDEELVIPDSFLGIPVKKVGEYAFYLCKKLKKVTLPEALIEIDNNAFEGCEALSEVIVGDRLEVIGMSAFRDSGLEKIELPDTVAVIEKYSFYRTKLTTFKVPASVSLLGKYAFYGCKLLESVVFTPRLSTLGEYCFHDCTALKEMVIPETITKIGDYCFRGCSNLEKLFIPKRTELGENVFLSCNALTIYTPKGSKAEAMAKKWHYSYKSCSTPDKMTEN